MRTLILAAGLLLLASALPAYGTTSMTPTKTLYVHARESGTTYYFTVGNDTSAPHNPDIIVNTTDIINFNVTNDGATLHNFNVMENGHSVGIAGTPTQGYIAAGKAKNVTISFSNITSSTNVTYQCDLHSTLGMKGKILLYSASSSNNNNNNNNNGNGSKSPSTPGFEPVLAIGALAAVAFVIRRRKA
jgi:PGF-CTERM protein